MKPIIEKVYPVRVLWVGDTMILESDAVQVIYFDERPQDIDDLVAQIVTPEPFTQGVEELEY